MKKIITPSSPAEDKWRRKEEREEALKEYAEKKAIAIAQQASMAWSYYVTNQPCSPESAWKAAKAFTSFAVEEKTDD